MSKRKAVIATDLMFAPVVAAMRMPILSREVGGLGMPTETIRATSEKIAAFSEGMVAANMAYVTAALSFWPEVMMGREPSLLSGKTMEKAMNAALAPSSRRVRANFKRLTSSR